MVSSRKIKALLVVAVLAAAFAATQAFADQRLQGVWLLEGPDHKGIIFSGNNFVIIDSMELVHLVGNFSISGNNITLNYTHMHDLIDDLWIPLREVERHTFSFRTNNILVIAGEVYHRS